MLKRLNLKNPNSDFTYKISNLNATKQFSYWQFHLDFDSISFLENLGCEKTYPSMSDILKVIGSHSTLWIGNCSGIVAPMDSKPQGWTYPNGSPLEEEWWWQWHPDVQSEKELTALINAKDVANNLLKPLVPFQLQENNGQINNINAIPLMRLPGLLKKDTPWVFCFEQNHI